MNSDLFQRILNAWSYGEQVNQDTNSFLEQLPEEVVFVTFCVVVVTTLYMAWHATTFVGKLLAFLRDTFYFFLRTLLFVVLLCSLFLYIVPPAVRTEIHELCAAIVAEFTRSDWQHSVVHSALVGMRTAFNNNASRTQ